MSNKLSKVNDYFNNNYFMQKKKINQIGTKLKVEIPSVNFPVNPCQLYYNSID